MTAQAPPVMRYPLAHVTYGTDEIAAVVETLEAGQTTCGPRVAAFEAAFAAYVGAKHAIMVNSGSSADLLLALTLNDGPAEPREEILVPAVTWPTQVSACLLAGYRVRLVDVDPTTLQMDTLDLDNKIMSETRAIFTTHALGNVGNMDGVEYLARVQDLALLEDCCEALGARWNGQHVGSFGYDHGGGAFSFFFSHVLSTMEGGMVVTNDDAAATRYRLWRSHGWEPIAGEYYHFPTWGMNLRPTELQGAFGLVQLGKLDGFLAARRRNDARLYDAIWHAPFTPHLIPIRKEVKAEPAWHAFPIMVEQGAPFTKGGLCAYLDAHGVETRPMIAGNIARQPAFANDPRVIAGPLPGADAIHDRGFYIGLASHDDEAGIAYVGETIDAFLRGQSS
jgi:CDP-4-dehydro-6-deoxyglucose reductase, E1